MLKCHLHAQELQKEFIYILIITELIKDFLIMMKMKIY